MVHVWHRTNDSFLMTYPGIDLTSNLSLFICRFLLVGCMHLPRVQYTMSVSQFKAQSGHCLLEDVFQSSKFSVLSMLVISSFDFSLNGLNCCVLSNPLLTSPSSGDSRAVESVFLRFPCDSGLLSGRLSEVFLEFCSQRYGVKFPCTYPADFSSRCLRRVSSEGERRVSLYFTFRSL